MKNRKTFTIEVGFISKVLQECWTCSSGFDNVSTWRRTRGRWRNSAFIELSCSTLLVTPHQCNRSWKTFALVLGPFVLLHSCRSHHIVAIRDRSFPFLNAAGSLSQARHWRNRSSKKLRRSTAKRWELVICSPCNFLRTDAVQVPGIVDTSAIFFNRMAFDFWMHLNASHLHAVSHCFKCLIV